MKHAIITDYLDDDLRPEREVLDGVCEVTALNAQSESELHGKIEMADALMVYHIVHLSRDILSRLRNCKVISRVGVGFDNVDGPAAREHGIPMVNIPDYGTEEVADSAMGLVLSLTRGIARYNRLCRDRATAWNYKPAAPLYRIRGRTLGIVGLGRIGSAMAIRAKAHGFDVAFFDPYRSDGYDKSLGIRRCRTLEQLFEASHVVSLHCPLTQETNGMVNAETLKLLQQGAYLVNTARGPIVDTSILPTALESGQLAGVGLDVLPEEPPRPDDPLLVAWRNPSHPAHSRAIINPHASFYCEEGLEEMRRKAAIACRDALAGRPLRNQVN